MNTHKDSQIRDNQINVSQISKVACDMNPLLRHLVEVNGLHSKKAADEFANSADTNPTDPIKLDRYEIVGLICGILLVVLWIIVLFGG